MRRSDPWSGLDYCPSMVFVPAGKFIMGHKRDFGHDADPHVVWQDQYWIGRYPVTVKEYSYFIDGDGYEDPRYWTSEALEWKSTQDRDQPLDWQVQKARENYPVVGISWYEALAYCLWLSEKLKEKVLLPTEAQWEKAARGTDGRDYPWGFYSTWATNHPVPWSKCNCKQTKKGEIDPVGEYSPESDSPYGVADMAGNVWEWTRTIRAPYPWSDTDGRNKLEGARSRTVKEKQRLANSLSEAYGRSVDPDSSTVNSLLRPETSRILRGGAWHDEFYRALCGCRYSWKPKKAADDTGFRIVIESCPPSGESYCPHCGEAVDDEGLFCEKCHREHSRKAPCGKLLVKATYYEGYPVWGSHMVEGQLIAGLDKLHFRGFNDQTFSLPWEELKIDTPRSGLYRYGRRPRQGVMGLLTDIIGIAQEVSGIELVWYSEAEPHRIFWATYSLAATSVLRQIEIFLEGKHDAY